MNSVNCTIVGNDNIVKFRIVTHWIYLLMRLKYMILYFTEQPVILKSKFFILVNKLNYNFKILHLNGCLNKNLIALVDLGTDCLRE